MVQFGDFLEHCRPSEVSARKLVSYAVYCTSARVYNTPAKQHSTEALSHMGLLTSWRVTVVSEKLNI